MKQNIVTLVLLACIASSANSQCSDEEDASALLAIWNNYFTEFPNQEHNCESGLYEDTLRTVCGRWNIEDYMIIYDDAISDNPAASLSDWQSMHNYRIFLSNTIGQKDRTDVEIYQSEEACEEALQGYRGTYDDSEIESGFVYGVYVISWLKEGIEEYFSNHPNKVDQLMVLSHSESHGLRDDYVNWPTVPPEGSGPAFAGYEEDHSPQLTTKCYNDRALIYSLGCYYWPGTGSPLSHAIHNTVWMVFSGNMANQMSCKESCLDWVARFVDVGACAGKVYWAVTGEDVGSEYSVLGYRSFGGMARPDTLRKLRGLGTDGYSRVRTYSCSASGAYAAFRVIETGNDEGIVAASRLFSWEESERNEWEERLRTQRDLALESANYSGPSKVVYELVAEDGKSTLVGRETGELDANRQLRDIPPLESECGDVVVYGRTQCEVERVKEHVEQYTALDGENQVRARCFVGSENPLDAQYAFMSTWCGNNAWFEYCQRHPCPRVYPIGDPGPMLILVGDANRIHHMMYEDDELHTCMSSDCRSDQDITDYYAEGRPWANVWRIPSEDLTETDSACNNFDVWNLGAEFKTAVALFCGNEYSDGYNYHLSLGMDAIADQYEAQGRQATLYTESDYDYDTCQIIGPQALEDVGELWVQGFETAAWWLTNFLNDDNVEGAPDNPIFIHAPSCQTGAVWWNENYQTTIAEYCMFERSAAGMIGHLNGDWAFRHENWRDLWGEMYLNAEPRQPLDLVVWNALEELRERHPRYARGVELLGGYLQVPPQNPAAVAATAEPVFSMSKETEHSTTRLVFTLPEKARVNLSIHDVTGREILSCIEEDLQDGVHSYTWDLRNAEGDEVASGIYFASLVATGEVQYRRSIKLSVVH